MAFNYTYTHLDIPILITPKTLDLNRIAINYTCLQLNVLYLPYKPRSYEIE